MSETHDYEFFETSEAFTRYLMHVLRRRAFGGIDGRTVFEPCVGNGAILRAAKQVSHLGCAKRWITNDLDPRWKAQSHRDATLASTFERVGPIDFTITNTPFTLAVPIAAQAIAYSRVATALYMRASIHEPLKEGVRRTWFAEHPPSGIAWLPRVAHQRSRSKGIWSTDSMTSAWVIWIKGYSGQFIEYAPASVLAELEAETPAYRAQMDALNGLTGTELERQAQWRARWLGR